MTKKITLPFTGATVEEHITHKKLDYSKLEAVLMLRSGETYITGHEFLKRLKESRQTLLNGDDLDYLLAHQELIPENLKGKYLYAFGSIFRFSVGDLYVRCVFVDDERWVSDLNWLDNSFNELGLALSLADTKKLKTPETVTLESFEALSQRVDRLEKLFSKEALKSLE